MSGFIQFSLCDEILQGLSRLGFSEPTPIQKRAIPVLLQRRDVIGLSQAGTGKTLAFGIPALQITRNLSGTRVLILAPTRELALQIQKDLTPLSFCGSRNMALLIGGENRHKQAQTLLMNPNLIIGTPGRVLDFMKSKELDFSQIELLILDEVDRILDLGFLNDVNEISKKLSGRHQTCFFSATFDDKVEKLVLNATRNPFKIQVGELATPVEKIRHVIYRLQSFQKADLLFTLLKEIPQNHTVIIFVRTSAHADLLGKFLLDCSLNAAVLHGKLRAGDRRKILSEFKQGKFPVLVATDLAARGIHVDDVNLVINFQFPDDPENFVHRLGRTGRAGKEGTAVTFLSGDEQFQWQKIQKISPLKPFNSPLPSLHKAPVTLDFMQIQNSEIERKEEANYQKVFQTGTRKKAPRRSFFENPARKSPKRSS